MKKTLENVKVAAEHPKVKETITKMGAAVSQLDTLAAGGIENLTARMPVLSAPTNELVETTKVFYTPRNARLSIYNLL